jgi:adenylate cyclase
MAWRILVVDDEPEIALLIRSRLESEGYQISVAADGVEALRKARVVRPDLIVLDVVLPKLDGGQVFAKLREDKKTRKIPIIFLTALKAKESDLELGNDVGLHTVFAKPFDPDELLGTIRDMLARV